MNLQLIHTRVINAGEEIYSYIDISILFIFVMEACMRERNYIVVYKVDCLIKIVHGLLGKPLNHYM